MVIYLLKNGACLLVFCLFYKLVLERQGNHGFKRLYLAGTLLLALGIPLIPMWEHVVPLPDFTTGFSDGPGARFSLNNSSDDDAFTLLAAGYWTGYALFALLFVRSLYRIVSRIYRNPGIREKGHTKVLHNHPEPPHAFLRYLFLNGKDYKDSRIPESVLAHEAVHIRQLHSLDLILAEGLLLLFWFNPVYWLYRNAIRLNHEFLADREVLRLGFPQREYQHTLLQYSDSKHQPAFANAINYSSIKKRITIMKTTSTPCRNRIGAILLAPVLVLTLLSFSSTKTVYSGPNEPEAGKRTDPKWESHVAIQPEVQPNTRNVVEPVTTTKAIPDQNFQKGASRDEMREYNELATKYNRMIEDGNIQVVGDEVSRMKLIYNRMSDKQRDDAEPFPKFPPPPPAPKPIAATQPGSAAMPVQASHPAHPAQPRHPAQTKPASPAPPPPAAPGEIREVPPPRGADVVPLPPPPPDPVKHFKELAEQGATFFHGDKAISPESALELVNSGKVVHMDIRDSSDGKPVVRINQ